MDVLQRCTTRTDVIDVLDHVLDKGIVIDAWARVSLVGLDLITVEARVVVASISTYVTYAGEVAELVAVSRPAIASTRQPSSHDSRRFSSSVIRAEVADARRTRALEEQLRRVGEQMEHRRFVPQERPRTEDRIREDHHDAQAKSLGPSRPERRETGRRRVAIEARR